MSALEIVGIIALVIAGLFLNELTWKQINKRK